jgi:hypothetical protein
MVGLARSDRPWIDGMNRLVVGNRVAGAQRDRVARMQVLAVSAFTAALSEPRLAPLIFFADLLVTGTCLAG